MNSNLAYQAEDIREELIGGRVAAMSPRPAVNHHLISENIIFIFKQYLKGKKCTPFGDGVDLYLNEKNRFVPDGMIVCDRDKIKWDGVHGAPDLVWEILSPSTMKNDRWYKKNVYAACGVPEYWIVDPKGQSVEVYLLQNGEYVLDSVCANVSQEYLERLDEKDRAEVPAEIRCHLYDDLIIRPEDIFYDLLN